MPLPKEQQKMLEKADTISNGNLSSVDLTCPYCGVKALIFSFTIIKPPRYGLFIVCNACKKWEHFQMDAKPQNFRDDLVIQKYQVRENKSREFAERLKNNRKTA